MTMIILNRTKIILFSLLLLHTYTSIVAQSTLEQNIKGKVIDAETKTPLFGATIVIADDSTSNTMGGVTDYDGNYKIAKVAVGRHRIAIRCLGYKETVLSNIVVSSAKEMVLNVELQARIMDIKEITVSAGSKADVINEMATVSARTFTVEETQRYAGSRDDAARMASNFAGVQGGDDSRNDIVIRGNSPTGVLWRIEGLNIPNPNHFATVGSTGGPVSAINTNILKNSDFFTSAFPAEYGNANAGVFDLGFRNGNAEKAEHTIQFGALTGIEAMTEGPINKEKGSSYLVAYRYSFTGLAQQIGIPIGTTATPFYQDISFKVNGANTKAGRFTLFGMAGKSKIEFLHTKTDSTDLFADPTKDSYFTSDIALAGVKHFIRVGEKSYINTVIGGTYAASNFNLDTIGNTEQNIVRVTENKATQIRYSVNSSFNSKINSKLFIKAGVIDEVINLNLFYRVKEDNSQWNQKWDYNDYTSLIQGYAHAKYNFNDNVTLNVGVHSQFLTLNNSFSIEPRAGIKYQLNNKNTVSVGYGMHSQMQPTDVYFHRELQANGTYDLSNKNLDFTRSQHFVLGYDVLPAKDWRVKVETYYQLLSNVPVTNYSSSFSMLNSGASFNPNEQGYLQNKGSGTNYGLELTIEKFFSKGYYGLITGTVYESKYKGSNGVEHNTAFNGKYVYNALVGKEFKLGKEKRNSFTIDVKMTQAGGRHYTPVDLAASQAAHEQVLMGDEFAFSKRNSDFFRLDIKTGITINSKKRKLSQGLFFDIQNITNNKNVFAERYNPVNNQINTAYQIGFFPNFSYKVQF